MQKLPRQRRKVHFLEMEPRSTSSSPPAPNPPPLLLLKLIFFFVLYHLNLFPNHSLLFLSLSLSTTPGPGLSLSLSLSSVGGSSWPNCSSLSETS